MFCGKCGAKLDVNTKFCGKCGTKVDSKLTDNANVNSLDSFIGNIVKKTDEQHKDHDIFEQLEKESNVKVEKQAKNKKINFSEVFKKSKKNKQKTKKTNSKSKAKKTKKPAGKKEPKKLNKKMLLFVLIAILIIIASVVSFILIKYGNDIFANKYVKNSISETLEQFDKCNDNLNSIPSLALNLNANDEFDEREVYLEIQNAKGGLINENVLGSLKGLSIKTNEESNTEKGLFKTKLTFANSKNEEMYGEICSSPDLATFSIPELYADTLGITLKEAEVKEEKTEETKKPEETTEAVITNSKYHTNFKEAVELLSQYEVTLTEGKKSVADKAKQLVINVITGSEFKLESENEDSKQRTYTTTLDNVILLESLKSCLTEVKEDIYIKKFMSYALYFIEGIPLHLTETSIIGKIDKLIENIDNAIESDRVEDIELKLIIDGDKIIDEVTFNTIIDGIGLSVNVDIKNDGKLFDYEANIKLSNADSYINLELVTLTKKISEDLFNKKNTITLGTSLNDTITLNIDKDYNIDDFNCNIDFTVDTIFENLFINYSIKGKYQLEKDVGKLNIESLKLNMLTSLYKFYFDFNGYIKQEKMEQADEISLDDVVFIDNMSEEELENIKLEIYKNGLEFLDLFGQGKW